MKKEEYVSPELEIIRIDSGDIITVSGDLDEGNI